MKRIVTAGVVALSIGMFGCTTNQAPTIDTYYYPECYDPIEKLCKDQDNSSEVKSAVVGGLVGAVAGGLIGGLTSKDKKGAIIGAVAGAAVGAAAGFFKARLKKIQDQEERLAEYQNLLGERSATWDLERASIEKAYDCYYEQIQLLKQAYKSKKMSKDEFLARAKEIKEGVENINTYWADAKTRMENDLGDGESFLAEEEAKAAKIAKAQEKKKAQQRIKNSLAKTKLQKQKNTEGIKKVDESKQKTMVAMQELDVNNIDNLLRTAEGIGIVEFIASL